MWVRLDPLDGFAWSELFGISHAHSSSNPGNPGPWGPWLPPGAFRTPSHDPEAEAEELRPSTPPKQPRRSLSPGGRSSYEAQEVTEVVNGCEWCINNGDIW